VRKTLKKEPLTLLKKRRKIQEKFISLIRESFSNPKMLQSEPLDRLEHFVDTLRTLQDPTTNLDKEQSLSALQNAFEQLQLSTSPQETIQPTEPVDREDLAELRFETRLIPLGEIMEHIKRKKWLTRFELFPESQTNTLWSTIAQSRWIESLMLALPLPPIWLGVQQDDHWLLYDGEQRVQSCRSFLVDKSLTLQGLEFFPQYEGKSYDELPRPLQRKILESRWTLHTIEKGSARQAKYAIIRRLQAHSTTFSNQIARELASNTQVRSFLQKAEETLRQEGLIAHLPKASHAREEIGLALMEIAQAAPSANQKNEDRLFEWMGQIEYVPSTYLDGLLESLRGKIEQEKNSIEEKQQQDLLVGGLLGIGTLALIAYLSKK